MQWRYWKKESYNADVANLVEKNDKERKAIQKNIDELLKFTDIATEVTELEGVEIPKGSVILIRYGSGNRDEDLFENPDKFDVTRKNARRHIAFGQGIHVCLGMNLARKEMYTAFPIILDRLKNMRFSEGNNFIYSPNVLLRGLDNLYIEFDKV